MKNILNTIKLRVPKNISYINMAKWAALFGTLLMTIFLVLTLYNVKSLGWSSGFGEWTHGSKQIIDANGNLITDPNSVGIGAGQLRLKQIIITLVGGGALAFAGVLLQKTSRNNLAEVSILGIGSINIMFIFAYAFIFKGQMLTGSTVKEMLPLVTISSSLIGTFIIYFISRSSKTNKNTFVIIGIALQLLFEALSVVFVNPSKLSSTKEGKEVWAKVKHYTMGIVDSENTSWNLIIIASIAIALLVVVALFLRKKIDIYEASPSLATTLGIRVEGLRITVFAIVALIAGIEASLLGTVALLGLIAPSIARLLFKNKFAPTAIASFIIGGVLVALASWVSTNLFGADFPAGILATAIATPYFIFLIIRGK